MILRSKCQLSLQSMIQQHKDYLHKDQLSRLLLFNNAIYQGGYSTIEKLVNGNGFVYFPKQSRVIICSNFKQGQINNCALVYHNAQKYLYGSWRSNKLDGLALIRKADTVLISYFSSGKISPQNKALLLLNEYQLGLIVRIKNGEWETVQRKEIICKQHILQLFKKCDFGDNDIPLSLISFLNREIAENQNQLARLRFVNNTYQYGFEDGLHLIFNRNEQLSGLKLANQNIFHVQDKVRENQLKKLISLVRKCIQRQRIAQVGTIYKQKQINHQYIFTNQFQDPSSQYFSFLQTTFNEALLKKLRAGFLRPNKNKNSQELTIEQFHLQLFPVNTQVFHKEAFQSQLKESIIQAINQQQESEQYSWQRSIPERDQVIENTSFQMLPQEIRLNIIKQQQREILISKLLRQKQYLNQTLRSQNQENQSLVLSEESHSNKQKLQDKQSQTEVVLYSSPVANKSQSTSPLSQKRKRAKIFNTEPPIIKSSPQKMFENKNIQVQTQKKSNNRLQIENVVNEMHLSRNQKKQVLQPHQIESRIAKEIENDWGDAISVNQINCSPIKKNKQFNLDNTQILTTPNRNKSINQTTEIKTNTIKKSRRQDDQKEPHFVAILNHENKSNKSNKKYDTEGLSDKKMLFDYILI